MHALALNCEYQQRRGVSLVDGGGKVVNYNAHAVTDHSQLARARALVRVLFGALPLCCVLHGGRRTASPHCYRLLSTTTVTFHRRIYWIAICLLTIISIYLQMKKKILVQKTMYTNLERVVRNEYVWWYSLWINRSFNLRNYIVWLVLVHLFSLMGLIN